MNIKTLCDIPRNLLFTTCLNDSIKFNISFVAENIKTIFASTIPQNISSGQIP
jgi:hypothetical protein